ncbi:AMMECR1 domain-containing protein [Leucosporidium creatinivorum]|uniref:AMMECR1 domain-containing protein n=1 Tax=Leucosporidium creatinivorum TaxID=106004 RepID=A0A1Y2FKH2_9BASI|nr:AMMECR1 domain-containing protein [Leucosporidium creatinivorum]
MPPPPSSTASDEGALVEHAYYCFDVINAKLNGGKLPLPSFDDAIEYPLFVTWNIVSRTSGQTRLRGCIGNFEPMRIGEGLKDYAAISAFKDHRFDPITAKELPRLECGVSLLTDFEVCDSYLDWDLDTHGIYIQLPNPALTPTSAAVAPPPPLTSLPPSVAASTISLTTDSPTARPSFRSISNLPTISFPKHPNPRRLPSLLTATYLPDVATAQGWTKVEAVDSAIHKAGFRGEVTEEMRRSCRVTRYQSRKVEVRYAEWKEWRGL